MGSLVGSDETIDPAALRFYQRTLEILTASDVRYLLGGAYAFAHYTGIERHTKDLDVFVAHADRHAALDVLSKAGYEAELTFPHWLGKVRDGAHYIDVIFGSGNGIARVDDEWFVHGETAEVLGRHVMLAPVEEMIWSKAFVMERERYDGADIAHIVRARGRSIEWDRLVRRFGPNWRVLFSHLVLFGFVYPGERAAVPAAVLAELGRRLAAEPAEDRADLRVCLGTLISRRQYLVDVHRWRYRDGRLPPTGQMSEEEIAVWTAAIADGE